MASESFAFNPGLKSHIFHDVINTVVPFSPSLIPLETVQELNHREVKWRTAFHFLGYV